MTKREHESFPSDVAQKLKTYVCRLIDPRSGDTFYVGKGKGNRVFAHILAEGNLDGDEIDNKLKRIRVIRLAGFEVGHVIHRHGMDEATAFEVEAALIDAYVGLTNITGGTGGNDYGVMHAQEIIRRYSAETGRVPAQSAAHQRQQGARRNGPFTTPPGTLGRSTRGRPIRRTLSSRPGKGSSSVRSSRTSGLRRRRRTSPAVRKAMVFRVASASSANKRLRTLGSSTLASESQTSTGSAVQPTRSSTLGSRRMTERQKPPNKPMQRTAFGRR